MKYYGKYSVLNIPITACDYKYAIHTIISSAQQSKHCSVAPLASHPLTLASHTRAFAKILRNFDMVLPDSQYIRHALYFLYGVRLKTRLYGPDLFFRLCAQAEKKSISLFLYGNDIKTLKKNLHTHFPQLRLEGVDLEGKKVTQQALNKLKNRLKKQKNYILCIGIGSPKQHYIMHELHDLPAPIMAVGAAFDFYAGLQPHTPVWLQNAGFEWLFRLLHSPKRLWKRYVVYGPLFVALIALQKLKQIKNNRLPHLPTSRDSRNDKKYR